MRRLLFFISFTIVSSVAMAADGLVTKRSAHGVGETLDRLEALLEERGLNVVVRWNHGERAVDAGVPLTETELLIFGNPKLGSSLMSAASSAGIDLPMKALAWRDESGNVWLAYNDPAYIADRHGIEGRDEVLKTMAGALDKLTELAASPE